VGGCKGIFYKELEKKLAQHKANERTYMYKLEAYQRTFLDFVCGSPTSIKVSCQDEENEAWPVGQLKKRRCKLKNHRYLKEEVRKIKNHR